MMERGIVAGVIGVALAAPIVAAATAIGRVVPGARATAWIVGALVAIGALAAAAAMRRRLPAALDGAARRRPLRAALWALLALVALAQVGRLAAFMANPALTFGSATPDPKTARHLCMSAYVYAAELARARVPNLYDEHHWPAFDEAAPRTTSVAELGPFLDDPYEYPPTFLLLPRLGLALTDHFLVMRAVWFALQAIGFILVALALAVWIGGRDGLVVGLMTPALIASVPGTVCLQWGQAHLLTFLLAMGALVAFSRGRAPLGGLLLGAATAFKLFPGLLILLLALRRRWRDVGWTIAAMAVLTLLALAVVGRAPFVEFVRYQLPRIGSGEAFSFFRGDWLTISRNFSIAGVVYKLGVLGVSGMSARVAGAVGWIYTLVLMALVVRAARRVGGDDRLGEALTWLALLTLGSLRSPLAPSLYVTVGAVWILMLLAARAHRPRDVALLVLAYLVIPGVPPLPSAPLDITVALVGQAATVAVALVAMRRSWPRQAMSSRASAPASHAS